MSLCQTVYGLWTLYLVRDNGETVAVWIAHTLPTFIPRGLSHFNRAGFLNIVGLVGGRQAGEGLGSDTRLHEGFKALRGRDFLNISLTIEIGAIISVLVPTRGNRSTEKFSICSR